MELEVNDIIDNLAEHNELRITDQRRKIIELLIENKGQHMSAEEIHHLAKKKEQPVALPTIYRTMGILEKKGVISKNDFGGGAAKYELSLGNHHHLICENCGKIIEVSGLLPADLEQRLLAEQGFQSKEQRLKIYGYCRECINKPKNPGPVPSN